MAVSSSSVRGFLPRKALGGGELGERASLEFIIDNSITLTLGDAVRIDTAGFVKRATVGQVPMGIVVGLVDQNGLNVFSPRVQPNAIAGATLTPDDTLVTATDNTSNNAKNLKAQILVDSNGDILYFNNANTTVALTNANLLQYFQLTGTGSGQIDTNTGSNVNGQFQLMQINPDGDGVTSKGLFRISECQLTENAVNYGTGAIRLA